MSAMWTSYYCYVSTLAAVAPLGHEPGQERERSCQIREINPSPQAMFACEAARWRAAMPEGSGRSSAKRRTQPHIRATGAGG
jgi:hypothetical protein